jgi:NAD+ diphosphatase
MRDPLAAPAALRFVAGGRQWQARDDARLFCYLGDQLLLLPDGAIPQRQDVQCLPDGSELHFVGRCHGEPCVAADLPDDTVVPDDWLLVDLRRFGLQCGDDALFAMAARAVQIVRWSKTNRFCSACGSSTHRHAEDFATVCEQCGNTQYPRIAPCIIVLVTRGDEALLARGANFGRPMYSTLAGFMEPGESAEEAVHREVWEETGIEIENPIYHSSQSWPFPHSLMLGFHADYAGGNIDVDEREIIHADWFTRDRLPQIPPPPSISRRLIDAWLKEK